MSKLYIIPTPIGNLEDITLRAIRLLKEVNMVLVEDTRVSKKLLSHYEIRTRLMSNYKFNEKKNLKKIIDILNEGKIVSLISDAGTPSISDPGRILIKQCIQNNLSVIPIPGPSAVSASMSISGFSDKFYFHGFLSDKKNLIKKEFRMFLKLECSIVFFISAKKLSKKFGLLKEYFPEREILICREITKIHEHFYRGKISEIEHFQFNPKGEVTVVISEKIIDDKREILDESDKRKIKKLILNTTVKDIVRIISRQKNISKSKIYNYCLQIKNEK